MKAKPILITSIILLSLIPLVPGYAKQSMWVMIERGENFERYQNSTNPNQYRWQNAPQWLLNSSGEYVPYIYARDEAKKCYTVQSGLIGFELYDTGIAKFYDPDLIDERVKSEVWKVWFLDKTVWKEATLSPVISFTITQDQNSITLEAERATSKPEGILTIEYLFNAGEPLKHYAYWESTNALVETIQIKQVWDLKLSTNKVFLDDGSLLTESTKTNSTSYLFGDNDNDFLVLESQWSATYYPNGTLRESGFIDADLDFAGKKVTFTFSNWTLAQGESLEIDPATSTLSNPVVDGYIMKDGSQYTRNTVGDDLRMGMDSSYRAYRAYVEWSISGIPDSSTITNVIFKFEGWDNQDEDGHLREMMGTRPSVQSNDNAGNQLIFDEVGEGTVYVNPIFPGTGTNRQVDLGTDADSDLEDQLTGGDWFAIGLKGDLEQYPDGGFCLVRSEEYGGVTPPPTLYVEYTPPNNAPNSPTLDTPANDTEVYSSKNVKFEWTFNDPDSSDTQSAYRLQIINISSMAVLIDTNKVSSSDNTTYQVVPSTFGDYYWRVKTWDNYDAEGAWSVNRTLSVINYAPYAPTITNPANNSEFEPTSSVNISWTFSDIASIYTQGAYQIQISDAENFTNIVYDSNQVNTSNEYAVTEFPTVINNYYLRIRNWDNWNLNGSWSSTLLFEIASAQTGGGWNPSPSEPLDSTDDTPTISPTDKKNMNLGIYVIIGVVGMAIFWGEASKKKKTPDNTFKRNGRKRNGNKENVFKKERKKKDGPKGFKRR